MAKPASAREAIGRGCDRRCHEGVQAVGDSSLVTPVRANVSWLREAAVVGHHHVDHISRAHARSLPQRPAAGPRPRRRIQAKTGTEYVSTFFEEEGPGDRQIARRITNPAAPEIDDRTQPTINDKEIGSHHVPVKPHDRTAPPRSERRIPHRHRSVNVDLISKRSHRVPSFAVVRGKRSTAKEVVLPRRRTACWVDPVKGSKELGERRGEGSQIRNAVGARGFALQPPRDRPRPREPATR
jgi:hypothetical protein